MKVYPRRHSGRDVRQEVVLMVGIAGSGKTTLARSRYAGHAHVSLDAIKTDWDRRCDLIREYESRGCRGGSLSGNRKAEYVLIEDALAAGKSVVVDDTNLTVDIRAAHVEHARMHSAEVRAVYFRNAERAYRQNRGRSGPERVPHGVIAAQRAELEPPEIPEGYASIRHIY